MVALHEHRRDVAVIAEVDELLEDVQGRVVPEDVEGEVLQRRLAWRLVAPGVDNETVEFFPDLQAPDLVLRNAAPA